MVDPMDMAVLSVAGLLVSMGLALTGFGMDTIYILVWQIAVLSGYDSLVKAPVIQAISLFSVQPLLLSKAEIRKHASRQMLWYFIPVTLISTPAGMATAEYISTETIVAIGGILVTFVAVFELYRTYDTIITWFPCYKKERNPEEKKTDVSSQRRSQILDFNSDCFPFPIEDDNDRKEIEEDSSSGRRFEELYDLGEIVSVTSPYVWKRYLSQMKS
jgi:uncharacterized membrane protein YfcA